MKKIGSFVTLVLLALTLNFVFASNLESIKPEAAQVLLTEKKAILIDVREPDETKEGVATGAVLLPLSTMKDKKEEWEKSIASLPKDKTIVVYCRSGRRSDIVGEELVKKGFKVLNMGGFDSWKKAGLPTTK